MAWGRHGENGVRGSKLWALLLALAGLGVGVWLFRKKRRQR